MSPAALRGWGGCWPLSPKLRSSTPRLGVQQLARRGDGPVPSKRWSEQIGPELFPRHSTIRDRAGCTRAGGRVLQPFPTLGASIEDPPAASAPRKVGAAHSGCPPVSGLQARSTPETRLGGPRAGASRDRRSPVQGGPWLSRRAQPCREEPVSGLAEKQRPVVQVLAATQAGQAAMPSGHTRHVGHTGHEPSMSHPCNAPVQEPACRASRLGQAPGTQGCARLGSGTSPQLRGCLAGGGLPVWGWALHPFDFLLHPELDTPRLCSSLSPNRFLLTPSPHRR